MSPSFVPDNSINPKIGKNHKSLFETEGNPRQTGLRAVQGNSLKIDLNCTRVGSAGWSGILNKSSWSHESGKHQANQIREHQAGL